ncbi:MAG: hypothetical protein QOH84_20 [Kribbellaceae bacterium]|nr:hypothetical protein [Kribbellaceae bacterium]
MADTLREVDVSRRPNAKKNVIDALPRLREVIDKHAPARRAS